MRTRVFVVLIALALVLTACETYVGVGYGAPVYGGWSGTPYVGPYGGVGTGVGLPVW